MKGSATNRTRILLIFLGLFFSIALAGNAEVLTNAEELPFECQIDCATPYGMVLGTSRRGIEAHSNCSTACVTYESNYLNNIYTGTKWQCVEYARRWLLVNKGVIYSDVDIAADIWNKIDYLTEVASSRELPLESRLNGSRQPPEIGDLLVYSREFNDKGHVAVVIDVDYENGVIEVGEQNYNNASWPGKFSRKIRLVKKGDNHWLLDEHLLGWKHIKNSEAEGR
jgi:hypothetical protein